MGENAPTAGVKIRDVRRQGWWWVGNETLDIYLATVGPSAWAVYTTLCRLAGVARETEVAHAKLCDLTGLSLPTIIDKLAVLAAPEIALITVEHQQAENGRSLPNVYTLLEPILVGPRKVVDVTKEAALDVKSDLWATRPLEAALTELPTAKNKLAVVARLYAMRFDADAYPFDFARIGKVAKSISGGTTRLCQFIWKCNVDNVRGNPVDYITAVLMREAAKPAQAGTARVESEDPQVAALRQARETTHA